MKINKNIAISDSGLVFNPVNGESFSVNPIGAEIISKMREGKQSDRIRDEIVEKYSVDPDTCEKDLQDFIDILTHHSIIDDNDEKKA